MKTPEKSDRSGFFGGEKNELYVHIKMNKNKAPYDIYGNELQHEYICDELMRRGVKIIKK